MTRIKAQHYSDYAIKKTSLSLWIQEKTAEEEKNAEDETQQKKMPTKSHDYGKFSGPFVAS